MSRRNHVRLSGAITSAEGVKARLAAWKMWFYGFRQLKIKVMIGTGEYLVNAKSMTNLMMLGAAQGSKLKLRCERHRRPRKALKAVQTLFDDRFGEGIDHWRNFRADCFSAGLYNWPRLFVIQSRRGEESRVCFPSLRVLKLQGMKLLRLIPKASHALTFC